MPEVPSCSQPLQGNGNGLAKKATENSCFSSLISSICSCVKKIFKNIQKLFDFIFCRSQRNSKKPQLPERQISNQPSAQPDRTNPKEEIAASPLSPEIGSSSFGEKSSEEKAIESLESLKSFLDGKESRGSAAELIELFFLVGATKREEEGLPLQCEIVDRLLELLSALNYYALTTSSLHPILSKICEKNFSTEAPFFLEQLHRHLLIRAKLQEGDLCYKFAVSDAVFFDCFLSLAGPNACFSTNDFVAAFKLAREPRIRKTLALLHTDNLTTFLAGRENPNDSEELLALLLALEKSPFKELSSDRESIRKQLTTAILQLVEKLPPEGIRAFAQRAEWREPSSMPLILDLIHSTQSEALASHLAMNHPESLACFLEQKRFKRDDNEQQLFELLCLAEKSRNSDVYFRLAVATIRNLEHFLKQRELITEGRPPIELFYVAEKTEIIEKLIDLRAGDSSLLEHFIREGLKGSPKQLEIAKLILEKVPSLINGAARLFQEITLLPFEEFRNRNSSNPSRKNSLPTQVLLPLIKAMLTAHTEDQAALESIRTAACFMVFQEIHSGYEGFVLVDQLQDCPAFSSYLEELPAELIRPLDVYLTGLTTTLNLAKDSGSKGALAAEKMISIIKLFTSEKIYSSEAVRRSITEICIKNPTLKPWNDFVASLEKEEKLHYNPLGNREEALETMRSELLGSLVFLFYSERHWFGDPIGKELALRFPDYSLQPPAKVREQAKSVFELHLSYLATKIKRGYPYTFALTIPERPCPSLSAHFKAGEKVELEALSQQLGWTEITQAIEERRSAEAVISSA